MKRTKPIDNYFIDGLDNLVNNNELKTIIKSFPGDLLIIDANTCGVCSTNMVNNDISKILKCYELTHNRATPCWENPDHQCECPLVKIKESGKPEIVEHTHYDKNGRAKNVQIYAFPTFNKKGELEKIIEFCIDVTKRKEVENYLNLLVNYTPRICFWVKDLHGKFLFVDKTKAYNYGEEPDYFIGKNERDLGRPEEEAQKIEEDEKWVINNKKSFPPQIEYLTRNGNSRILLSVKTPFYNEKGEIIGTFGHAIDITRREQIKDAFLKILKNFEKNTLEQSLENIVEIFATMMDFKRVSIAIPNKDGDWIIKSGYPKNGAHGIGNIMLPQNTNGNLLKNIIENKPTYMNNPEEEAEYIHKNFLREHNISAIAIVPFSIINPTNKESMGLLAVDITKDREYQEFTAEDKDLIEFAATILKAIFAFYNEQEARIKAEKIAYLNKIAMSIMHEIRQDEVVAGGFIQRAIKKYPESEELKIALNAIKKIAEKIKKVTQITKKEGEKLNGGNGSCYCIIQEHIATGLNPGNTFKTLS